MTRAGVTHWFAGHYHRNAGGIFTLEDAITATPSDNDSASVNKIPEDSANVEHKSSTHPSTYGKSLEVVVTTAVGATITTNPDGSILGISGMGSFCVDARDSGYRICTVSETGLTHQFVNLSKQTVDVPQLSILVPTVPQSS
jgi:hypothetical protein